MTGDLGTYIIFGLGVLVGGLLFNKDFRYKFFTGFRKFLGGISKGAQDMNMRAGSGGGNYRREQPRHREEVKEKPDVQHVYKEVHQRKVCPICEGSGRVYEKVSKLQEGAPGYKPRAIMCPGCEGEGKIWS